MYTDKLTSSVHDMCTLLVSVFFLLIDRIMWKFKHPGGSIWKLEVGHSNGSRWG